MAIVSTYQDSKNTNKSLEDSRNRYFKIKSQIDSLEKKKKSKFTAIGKLEIEIARLKKRNEKDISKKSILWDEITEKEQASKKLTKEYIKIVAELQEKKAEIDKIEILPNNEEIEVVLSGGKIHQPKSSLKRLFSFFKKCLPKSKRNSNIATANTQQNFYGKFFKPSNKGVSRGACRSALYKVTNLPINDEQYHKTRRKIKHRLKNKLRMYEGKYALDIIDSACESTMKLGEYIYEAKNKEYNRERSSESSFEGEKRIIGIEEVINLTIPKLGLSIEQLKKILVNDLVAATEKEFVENSTEFIIQLYQAVGYYMRLIENSRSEEQQLVAIELLFGETERLYKQNPKLGKNAQNYSPEVYQVKF